MVSAYSSAASGFSGQVVELQVKGRFIKSLAVLEGQAGPTAGGPSKDILIIRQTCLKAAAEFAAARPDLKSADVIKVAQRWETWVLR